MATTDKKMTMGEFVVKAIEKGRTSKSQGIHVVFSGFNEAFKAYFDGADPRASTATLQAEGLIVVRPCRGGAMIYKAAEAPVAEGKGTKLLASMGV